MRTRIFGIGLFLLALCLTKSVEAFQEWQLYDTGCQSSLRGLAAIDRKVVWACGSQGTMLRTVDGGATWKKILTAGLEASEFRSIHAWDSKNAIEAILGDRSLQPPFHLSKRGKLDSPLELVATLVGGGTLNLSGSSFGTSGHSQ